MAEAKTTKSEKSSKKTSLNLEKLKERQRQIQEQIKLAEARESERQRKEETRRKILIGASILEEVDEGKFPKEKLQKILDSRLKRPGDRQLFDLPESITQNEAKPTTDDKPTNKKSPGS